MTGVRTWSGWPRPSPTYTSTWCAQSDLEAVRSELEGTFTHQLAVALYELMAASNARFAAAEDSINQRVDEAVERHVTRLAASLDAHHEAATERSRLIWAEMDSLRQRFIGPVEGLAAFQRELRHEVGRLSDLVSDHGQRAARPSGRRGGGAAELRRALAQAADDMGDVSEALSGDEGGPRRTALPRSPSYGPRSRARSGRRASPAGGVETGSILGWGEIEDGSSWRRAVKKTARFRMHVVTMTGAFSCSSAGTALPSRA